MSDISYQRELPDLSQPCSCKAAAGFEHGTGDGCARDPCSGAKESQDQPAIQGKEAFRLAWSLLTPTDPPVNGRLLCNLRTLTLVLQDV